MTDYSERIPAAIARAKEHLPEPNPGCLWPNEVEVALAEALHKTYRALNAESGEEHWPDALIAYCEKIEALA